MIDWSALRRVVTGDDKNGRSRLVIDGAAAKLLAVDETGLAEIWEAPVADLLSDKDRLSDESVRLEPAPGAVKMRWFTVAPEDPSIPRKDLGERAGAVFAAIGAGHARVDTTRHPLMHKTETLDAIIVVKGEVDLLLDDGSKAPEARRRRHPARNEPRLGQPGPRDGAACGGSHECGVSSGVRYNITAPI